VSNSEVSVIINSFIDIELKMESGESEKEKDLIVQKEKEQKEEKKIDKAGFFLQGKWIFGSIEEERKEGKTEGERDKSASFFIPGEITEIKGRLKD
jgi:hypothetical protein